MDEDRRQRRAPWAAAVAAAATVLAVLLPARSGQNIGPVPPVPVGPAPQALDLLGQSLDRCADALDSAGFAGRYPERTAWRPIAQLVGGGTSMTLLDAEVPFVCATGPSTVEVSDPQAAVPIDRALLIASTPSGLLAAVAPAEARVEVTVDGERPSSLTANTTFLRLAPRPITNAGQLAVTISDARGVRTIGAPERLAPPALRVVDRKFVPADPSTGAADLLRRCLAVAGADAAQGWAPAQVLAYRGAEQPASLLVAAHPSAVGGCSVAPGEVTPLRPWGPSAGGARPFVWLSPLPDLAADLVAGPARAEVVRMEVSTGDGRRWPVAVAGGTFAGQAPPGAPTDPRSLTVSAYAADDTLLYEGPAVG
jgi:hypothetical protein